ncbi:hypothetical protein [Bacteroides uniformis]|nr:hypothetical protein [Bacteroides uniformis]
MEELQKRLRDVIASIEQEKREIMGLLTPMVIKKCNSNPSKSEFNLKSLNKNIIVNYDMNNNCITFVGTQ